MEDFRVFFDTDCNVCARFELEHGGHSIKDNLAYITVGTGVGVGFVINGQCVHGLIHPEGGHIPLERYAKEYPGFIGVSPTNNGQTPEGLCSNVAIAKRLGLPSVADVAKIPDDHEVWEIVGHYLGTMCANLTLTLSVEKIVLGGGVIMRGEPLLKHIRSTFKQRIGGYLKHKALDTLDSYIVRSKFQNELGLVSSASVSALGDVIGHSKMEVKEVAKPVVVKKKLPRKELIFEKQTGNTLIKKPGIIDGRQFKIADLKQCNVYLYDHFSQITVDRCENCKFFIGPVKQSIFFRDCSNCEITVACGQFRCRDLYDCKLYLYTVSDTTIESSERLEIAPYNFVYG